MSRTNIATLLPIGRWAKLVGINPRHFSQLSVPNLDPVRLCKNIWTQYAWQTADHIGRDEVAMAIQQAEAEIIDVLGFPLIPIWFTDEIHRTGGSSEVADKGSSSLETPAKRYMSVNANSGHVISGGIRAVERIQSVNFSPGGCAAWFDLDNDLYFETCEIVIPYARTDASEIRVYFEDQDGVDEWEVRPLRSVVCDGSFATIQFDRHLIVDPNLQEIINPQELDAMVDDNFEGTLEVCRVYNDPSQQARMEWERIPNSCDCGLVTCPSCAWTTQWACLQTRDPRLGIVTYQPSEWDSADEQFDPQTIAVSRKPERVTLWYRAGYQSPKVRRPIHEMDPLLEQMVVRYSLCLLDRPVCGCSNVENFYNEWTEDRALVAESYHRISQSDLNSEFGTKKGALWAWRQAKKLAIGQVVNY